jgi:hypothetical protein
MRTTRIRGLTVACVIISTATLADGQVQAQTQDRSVWFKSLKQPQSGFSCCDVADCHRTDADWHGGQWWAIVAGRWTPIPHDKELDKQSLDGDAYVCSSPSGMVYCFVKPSLAM